MRCVLHGSFRRHLPQIVAARDLLVSAGVDVVAPSAFSAAGQEDGFVFFEGEEDQDPRLIELRYLQGLRRLGREGFSLFVLPEGYIGRTACYELGIAQLHNVPVFCTERPQDLPAYVPSDRIWAVEDLAGFIAERGCLPRGQPSDEPLIRPLWEDLMVPGSVVAVGCVIEHRGRRGQEPEVLLVRTHKWAGRWSMVGEKVRRNESLRGALMRGAREETGLLVQQGPHVCTFDQVKGSGYYLPGIEHVFVDYVAEAEGKTVRLNEEAQEFAWMPASEALDSLDIEPNARHTLEQYAVLRAGGRRLMPA
jgi:ADP-ribose pyrophosphatase YjhB (NUDIX family)